MHYEKTLTQNCVFCSFPEQLPRRPLSSTKGRNAILTIEKRLVRRQCQIRVRFESGVNTKFLAALNQLLTSFFQCHPLCKLLLSSQERAKSLFCTFFYFFFARMITFFFVYKVVIHANFDCILVNSVF